MQTGDNFKPFKCSQCSSTFKYCSGFNKHVRNHEEQAKKNKVSEREGANVEGVSQNSQSKKIYTEECAICDKKFPSKSHMLRHLSQRHFGIKNFTCAHCNGRFAAKHHLAAHISNIHMRSADVCTCMCVHCGTSFINKQALSNHINHRCLKINRNSNGIDTERISNVEMLDKNKSLDAKWGLDISQTEKVKVDGKILYKCNFCSSLHNKFSNLKKHMLTHSTETKHKCFKCDAKFRLLSNLRKHLKDIHQLRCLSNNNEVMLNALNGRNFEMFVPNTEFEASVKLDNRKNKSNKKKGTEKHSEKNCEVANKLSFEECEREKEFLPQLSMPLLNDVIVFANDHSENISNCHKEIPTMINIKSIENKNKDTHEISPPYNETCSNTVEKISIPLFRDALIGQANAVLIEHARKYSSGNQETSVPMNAAIDDINYEVACSNMGDDYILTSDWNIYDNGMLPINPNETIEIPTNSQVESSVEIKELSSKIQELSSCRLNNSAGRTDILSGDSSWMNVSLDINNLSFETDKNAIELNNDCVTDEKYETKVPKNSVNSNDLKEVPCINSKETTEKCFNNNLTFSGSTPMQNPLDDISGCSNNSKNLNCRPENKTVHILASEDSDSFKFTLNEENNVFNFEMINSDNESKISLNQDLVEVLDEINQIASVIEKEKMIESKFEDINIAKKNCALNMDVDKSEINFMPQQKFDLKQNHDSYFRNEELAHIGSGQLLPNDDNNYKSLYAEYTTISNIDLFSSDVSSENHELAVIKPQLCDLPKNESPLNNITSETMKELNKTEKSSDEKILCAVCGKLLKSSSIAHHKCTATYRYKCPFCYELFITSDSQKRHVNNDCGKFKRRKITKEVELANCAECDKNFSTKSSLQRHLKSKHNDRIREYKCPCGVIYFTNQELENHKRKYSNLPHVCPYLCKNCKKIFSYKSEYLNHLKLCKNK